MKRAVMTALVVSLLGGTSALAQDANSPVVRLAREMAARSESQRTAPPPRENRAPQAQASSSRGDRAASDTGRRQSAAETPRYREPQGQRPTSTSQAQSQSRPAGSTAGQRPQGQWQGQRPDTQSAGRGQGRPDLDTSRGQRPGGGAVAGRPQGAPQQGRADSQYRGRDNPPVVGVARDLSRELAERDRANNRRPGWNDNDRDRNWDRRPVIRPEDRRDRDRNRYRYDERRFPRYVTSHQRYRWIGPVWRAPVGYYSFRWQWGQTLPWNWYTPDYYLNDYWRYGLPMPPIGCEWVRVGDDAILVDVFNGRVYQVVYNLFW